MIIKRRKRTVRSRCASRARERSPTPDAKEIIGVYDKVASVVKLAPKKHVEQKIVINIVAAETQENDVSCGNKENHANNITSEKEKIQLTKVSSLDRTDERIVDTIAELEDEDEWKDDSESEEETLSRCDPRFVPKNIAFYMHDTGRTTTIEQRTPFAEDEKDDEVKHSQLKSFQPTSDGKWKHDMYDKICDKTKIHTWEDHWGKSYGFTKPQLRSGSKPTGTFRNSSKGLCWDWLEGPCNYGYSCKFLHDEGDRWSEEYDALNGMNLNLGVCLDFKEGKCLRGSRCRFSHIGNDGSEPALCRW